MSFRKEGLSDSMDHGGCVDFAPRHGRIGRTFSKALTISNSPPICSRGRACHNKEWRCAVACLLVIEDERKVLRGLQRGLSDEGYEVVGASTGDAGYQLALARPFECIILDLLLPGK